MAKTAATTIDLQPIDRLEQKVRALVDLIERLRSEQARIAEDNRRLAAELDAVQARLAEAAGAGEELAGLREEREAIRGRVAEMLTQLEGLNL